MEQPPSRTDGWPQCSACARRTGQDYGDRDDGDEWVNVVSAHGERLQLTKVVLAGRRRCERGRDALRWRPAQPPVTGLPGPPATDPPGAGRAPGLGPARSTRLAPGRRPPPGADVGHERSEGPERRPPGAALAPKLWVYAVTFGVRSCPDRVLGLQCDGKGIA